MDNWRLGRVLLAVLLLLLLLLATALVLVHPPVTPSTTHIHLPGCDVVMTEPILRPGDT